MSHIWPVSLHETMYSTCSNNFILKCRNRVVVIFSFFLLLYFSQLWFLIQWTLYTWTFHIHTPWPSNRQQFWDIFVKIWLTLNGPFLCFPLKYIILHIWTLQIWATSSPTEFRYEGPLYLFQHSFFFFFCIREIYTSLKKVKLLIKWILPTSIKQKFLIYRLPLLILL